MSRDEKIFSHIDRTGKGLEIGAGYNPVAPRKAGFNVDVLDHMTREELVRKYREQESCKYQGYHFPVENIQDVDYVWKGEPYAELIGKTEFYDWIIASHVVEHVPDFIGFLNECASVLKTTGVVSLAVPDVRYHFDYFRPIAGLSKIIDAHVQGNRAPTEGAVAEFYLNIISNNGHITWCEGYHGELALLHSAQDAIDNMNLVRNEKAYVDVHVWQFTPSSFRLLIHDLHLLGMIPLQEISYHPSDGCEFFITLGRPIVPPPINRLDLLRNIKRELSDPSMTAAGQHAAPDQVAAVANPNQPTDVDSMPANRWREVVRRMKRRVTPVLRTMPPIYATARGVYKACRLVSRPWLTGNTR